MLRRHLLSVCLFALMTMVAATGSADAANFLEKGFWLRGPGYESNVPPCGAHLDDIAANFVEKEAKFWNSNLYITGFTHVREIAFRPWEPNNIPRRFCSGRALISDGIWRTVHYSIIEDGGMIGWSWGVQWCVVGIDRNWAYNPACKMAKP